MFPNNVNFERLLREWRCLMKIWTIHTQISFLSFFFWQKITIWKKNIFINVESVFCLFFITILNETLENLVPKEWAALKRERTYLAYVIVDTLWAWTLSKAECVLARVMQKFDSNSVLFYSLLCWNRYVNWYSFFKQNQICCNRFVNL